MSSSLVAQTNSEVAPTDSPRTNAKSDQPKKRAWSRMLLGTFLVAAAAGGYWWSLHKYEYTAKRFGVVVPEKIYRSGQLTPQMLGETLSEHGITTLIDLQLNDIHDQHQQTEIQYAKQYGLRHFRFPLAGDGTGDVKSYVEAVSMLIQCERENQPVLVHCAAGTQRTGGIVACYRLLIEQADPQSVVDELREYQWTPSEGTELPEYINTHLPYIANQLVERGLLDRVPSPMPMLEI